MSAFVERIQQACQNTSSLVCVGLDPDPASLPVSGVLEFNRAIVDATAGTACAYKPNLAFYEALGREGMEALEQTVAHIREVAPQAVVIGDAKRGDIGPSARAYAKAMFEVWRFDAVTINAWGGSDSVEPFLEDETKGVFVWCRGSNPGSGDFQDLVVDENGAGNPLYETMARACSRVERARQRRVGRGGNGARATGRRSGSLPRYAAAGPGGWCPRRGAGIRSAGGG